MSLHFVVHDHMSHGLVGWVGTDADQPLHFNVIFHDSQLLLMDVVRTIKEKVSVMFDVL